MKRVLKIIYFLIVVIVSMILIGLDYVSQKTKHEFLYFPKIIIKATRQNDIPNHLNIMILGLDRRNDWLEKTETTDTIIFSQVNFKQNKIKLFSLPRDLWNYYTGKKINQIYPSSLEKANQKDKFEYISQNYASISGQPIDRVLILTTENLKQLADVLGGIDLFLENGFKDEKYPNDEYILNPKSGASIYKTVEFKSGLVHLDSSNITEFVRSRKSTETAVSGGTDLGRIERQQQLINALIDKGRSTLVKNPQSIIKLYNFWSSLEHNFSDVEFVTYFLKYGINLSKIKIIRYPISSGEDSKKDILYHPTRFINSQWVFIPHEKNYKQLHEFISQSLDSQ
jgi:LCP family protein required for cell wall assembly